LCLKAGQESCRASAFGAAASYLEFGIDMMEGFSWSGDYSLKLALYNAAAEMELTISNYERVHELVQTVLDNVKKLKHKLQAYNTLIYAYGVTDQQSLAGESYKRICFFC
jgi:histidine kinase